MVRSLKYPSIYQQNTFVHSLTPLTPLSLSLPGSTSTMRLSCVRLLRSSWLKVRSIITISDDGLKRCGRKEGGGGLYMNACMSACVHLASWRAAASPQPPPAAAAGTCSPWSGSSSAPEWPPPQTPHPLQGARRQSCSMVTFSRGNMYVLD